MASYIFYTHNTFYDWHVRMALESIANQDCHFFFDEFVIYNNSTDVSVEYILKEYDNLNLRKNFRNIKIFKTFPDTTKVCVDLENQCQRVADHDWYLCHKGDFYLPKHFIGSLMKHEITKNKTPQYLNFCKFDLRETVGEEMIKKMSNFKTFDEMCQQDFTSYQENKKYAPDIGIQHLAIGYKGSKRKNIFDGVMHAYNDKARKSMNFFSYWDGKDILKLRNKGIKMEIDQNELFTLHMFHDIGRKDPMKNIPGHRF